MIWLIVLVGLVWAVPYFHLRGRDLAVYDKPIESSMGNAPASEAHAEVREWAAGMGRLLSRGTPKQRLARLRRYMDDLGDEAVFDGSIMPVESGRLAVSVFRQETSRRSAGRRACAGWS